MPQLAGSESGFLLWSFLPRRVRRCRCRLSHLAPLWEMPRADVRVCFFLKAQLIPRLRTGHSQSGSSAKATNEAAGMVLRDSGVLVCSRCLPLSLSLSLSLSLCLSLFLSLALSLSLSLSLCRSLSPCLFLCPGSLSLCLALSLSLSLSLFLSLPASLCGRIQDGSAADVSVQSCMQADDLSTFHWHNLLDLMWKCIHVASLASISYFVLASPIVL